ncbi:MAG: di-trans,poly-cis-decaprenylcistransferase [Tenericutes bacterium]|nr:di-trans,poly-cis-decaprenylcistransferase [Mycoplasmatota bacterium]
MTTKNIPNHVGLIMDGNGRWATAKGRERTYGHYMGYKRLKKTATHILNKGVKILSVFAFSTENFQRPKEEVDYLMDLFLTSFKKEIKYFVQNNVKVVFSGRKEPLSDTVYDSMKELEMETISCDGGILNICLNYGGQAEIVDASKLIAESFKNGKIKLEDITVESFYNYLYNELPAIDLLIRTSGELRLSNFMLYSISYSELYFTNTCFPDFDEKEFDEALESYQNRNITKGTIKQK